MKKDNIVLIGMPGVGKSTVGVILAKVLGFQFVDADLVIQEKEGKLLREIIAEEGPSLLVDDRIDRNRCLTGLSVTDDQLTLSTSDRHHGIDCLDTGL